MDSMTQILIMLRLPSFQSINQSWIFRVA